MANVSAVCIAQLLNDTSQGPGGAHYYPVLLKPYNYTVNWCNHDDVSYATLSAWSPDADFENLCHLMAAENET